MKKSNIRLKIISLITLLSILVLEVLPYGVALNFATPDEKIRETFSYFSLTPFGYANFFPLLTGLLTIFITLLSLIDLLKKVSRPWLKKTILIGISIALILSVLPGLVFGSEYMTPVSFVISSLFLFLLALQVFISKKEKV